jgi:rifampicin phosphotransferase
VDFSGTLPRVTTARVAKHAEIRLTAAGGTRRRELNGAAATRPTLSEAEAVEIAALTRRLGERFDAPQDVEWALEGGDRRLRILQARPITTLPKEPEGERRVWDNSNIVESYSGITSPLTFSFALAVYEDVYRQFCAVVGVPPALVDRHRHVFANMLGLVRGRVYYHLLNWYRTLALLPGYAVNRAFMERMMGVREKLENPPELRATSGRIRDSARLARMVARLMRQSRGLSHGCSRLPRAGGCRARAPRA